MESSSLYQTFTRKNQAHFIEPSKNSDLVHWKNREAEEENFAASVAGQGGNQIPGNQTGMEKTETSGPVETGSAFQSLYARFSADPLFHDEIHKLWQLQNTYIVCETNGGFLLIHQQAAHERVLYEKFMLALSGKPLASQPGLFPTTLTLATADAVMLDELLPALKALGFVIEHFGKDSFIVQGTPSGSLEGDAKKVIEKLLEHCKHSGSEKINSLQEKMIRSLAWQQAVKPGTSLNETEMRELTESLFRCLQPNTSPNGKPVFIDFKPEYLEKVFGRKS